MQLTITKDTPHVLKELITEYNELFLRLVDKHLKPKDYFACQYSYAMALLGPLRNIWAMRFEGKDRSFKKYYHVNHSRKNLNYSFVIKHQLGVCKYFLNNIFSFLPISYKPYKESRCDGGSKVDFENSVLQIIKQVNVENHTL